MVLVSTDEQSTSLENMSFDQPLLVSFVPGM
jgi:hypothetical protein